MANKANEIEPHQYYQYEDMVVRCRLDNKCSGCAFDGPGFSSVCGRMSCTNCSRSDHKSIAFTLISDPCEIEKATTGEELENLKDYLL